MLPNKNKTARHKCEPWMDVVSNSLQAVFENFRKGWGHGSSGRVSAQQVQSNEFKPQHLLTAPLKRNFKKQVKLV
jgi:hypothetical protein